MKKVFSIIFAMIILVSGMNLTVASHICGGEVAAVKWSFFGKKATCGMEDTKSDCPVHKVMTSGCCQNRTAEFSVDENYFPTVFNFEKSIDNLLQIFVIPARISGLDVSENYLLNDFRKPRDKPLTSEVYREMICVFII